MAFFHGATYLGFFVLLAGAGLAYRGGSGLSEAVLRGIIGFGLVLVVGYVADVVAIGAALKPERRFDHGPVIRTMATLGEGAGVKNEDSNDGGQQLAA